MFFSFILLLFFVVAYPQQFLVEGTKPTRPAKLQTGNKPLQQPLDPKIFSLTDLSFLIRILNNIRHDELTAENITIEQILENKGQQILVGLGIQAEQTFADFKIKMEAVIGHFTNYVLRPYLNALHIRTSLDPNVVQEKLTFIYERLIDYGRFMARENFIEFLAIYGIEIVDTDIDVLMMIDDEVDNVEYDPNLQYPEVDTVNAISDEIREQLYNLLRRPSQKEKNLFIYYHLLAIARTLIRLFFAHYDHQNVDGYRQLFEMIPAQISMRAYAFYFRSFEFEANNLNRGLLSELTIFTEITNFHLVRDHPITNLNLTEHELLHVYQIRFAKLEGLEDMRRYLRIIF
uniref:Uncharacterized protein n=1 Tax=Meloidogyne floridensis TaxID=298350 RepID=A0A915NG53_9BILA